MRAGPGLRRGRRPRRWRVPGCRARAPAGGPGSDSGAASGDARAGREVAQPRARVASDARQHPGVAGQEAPARHPQDSTTISRNLLLVFNCSYRLGADTGISRPRRPRCPARYPDTCGYKRFSAVQAAGCFGSRASAMGRNIWLSTGQPARGEIPLAAVSSVLQWMGSPGGVVHWIRGGDDDVEVVPVGVHDAELVDAGPEVVTADQDFVAVRGPYRLEQPEPVIGAPKDPAGPCRWGGPPSPLRSVLRGGC
jgi:hypothetical protein